MWPCRDPCPVLRREDGGWWRSWLQQSYQAVKEKVRTAGTGQDRDQSDPGSVRTRINQNRAGPAGQPREPSEATGLEHSSGGSPQVRIRMDLLGIFWLSELWVMLGSVM